ncbi:MAG: metal ABC transporter permease [bacterium]|nr:metal ABC transporter permease [bacterium]
MQWTDLDTRIVTIAALTAVACAIPGTFLVLRRMSMLTHAIAHAVLPGLVLAFLVAGTVNVGVLMIGALVVAMLTAALIEGLTSRTGIEQGAATGVVFTAMFALGILLLRVFADGVHLHADCVIEGQLTLAATDRVEWLGLTLPRAAWLLLGVIAINATVLAVCWRPMVASVFDPDHARLQGLHPQRMHQLLMVMTAATTIAAFEAVGSILVVALFVIPAATALLLADRLVTILVLAIAIGVFSAFAGHVFAVVLPGPIAIAVLGDELGGRVTDTSSAGMIAVTQGLVFAAAALALGRDSLLRRRLRRRAVSRPGAQPA